MSWSFWGTLAGGGGRIAFYHRRGREGDAHAFPRIFTVNIRNPNTRAAYHRAAVEFLAWCEARKIGRLEEVQPVHVAAYIEQLGGRLSAPSIKQHLSDTGMAGDAIRYTSPYHREDNSR